MIVILVNRDREDVMSGGYCEKRWNDIMVKGV